MDMSILKDGRVQFRYLGVKGLIRWWSLHSRLLLKNITVWPFFKEKISRLQKINKIYFECNDTLLNNFIELFLCIRFYQKN